MKLIDKFNTLLNKVGVDKVLHRLVGDKVTLAVLFAAYVLANGATDTMLAADVNIGVLLLVVSFIKEQIDSRADYKDLLWAMFGWFFMSLFVWALIGIKNLQY